MVEDVVCSGDSQPGQRDDRTNSRNSQTQLGVPDLVL